MRKLLLCATLICCIGSLNAQNALTATEQKIMQYIREHFPDAEKLLQQTVDINSGTLNKAGVKKVGAVFAAELEKAGFKIEWINLPDSLNRAGHLVATRKGSKGKRLFLIGHLDTVFEPDMPANPYHRINDSTASGQGVNDMKGGDVVVIKALQALDAEGLLKDANITVYFTGDEEKAGVPTSVSRKDFIERAKQSDIALAFETATNLSTVATARRGSSNWRLNVTAKTGHSAGVFGSPSGYGAIYEAARILNAFRENLSSEKFLTFNPGLIAGGSEIHYDDKQAKAEVIGKNNIIAPAVTVTGDLRFLTEQQKNNAREKMKMIAGQHLNGTTATLIFSDGIPAMEPTVGNRKLLALLDQTTRDMGFGASVEGDPGSRGAGDISYIAKYVDCLDGLGASGKGAHAAGETIQLNELTFLTQRTALLIYRLTQSKP